ncbi:MAG: RNA pseudouridine synthase [Spirochaetaceae bacterium]|jgi:23S rRNA pseudouridine1911/1915/1917 synthase|nr:RNA pseudouridine synthase [Spirochaetaceae bacterium]
MIKKIKEIKEPYIAAETPLYIVVGKPHNMHTAPLNAGDEGTLLGWCARLYPEVAAVCGRKPVEGGLLHRLDYETAGLVLVARAQAAYNFLSAEQEAGRFAKDYTAVARELPPDALTVWRAKAAPMPVPGIISSGFRHYGPGRKLVKPEMASGQISPDRQYETQVLGMREHGADTVFHVRLVRGFRHQIRAHLAWAGYPINNDLRYGGADTGGTLGLAACRLMFPDPEKGTRSVCIECL